MANVFGGACIFFKKGARINENKAPEGPVIAQYWPAKTYQIH